MDEHYHLDLVPAIGPPAPAKDDMSPYIDGVTLLTAAAKTVDAVSVFGNYPPPPSADTEPLLGALLNAYTKDPKRTLASITVQDVKRMSAEAIAMINQSLKDYSASVVESSQQLRTYVTNKLLEETVSHNAQTRIRALELLGKISDVALFAEKTDITITHQTDETLRNAVLAKLDALKASGGNRQGRDVEDAQVVADAPRNAAAGVEQPPMALTLPPDVMAALEGLDGLDAAEMLSPIPTTHDDTK